MSGSISNAKPKGGPYDAIIIGGGHNGLTCAAYLARAGRRVLVLERRPLLGGAAVSEEVYPGFRFSVASYVVSLLRPQIIRDLDLARRGVEIIPLASSFSPTPDGRGLLRGADAGETRREIAYYSARDADRYPEFGHAMVSLAGFVKPLLEELPANPRSLRPSELRRLLQLAKRARALGPHGLLRLIKMMTMSSADFLDEWFESDVLKAPMAVSGIIGTYLGVRSPGTAYVLLHHYMGEIDGAFRAWGFCRGGTGTISVAIAEAARDFGAEICTEAEVERVNVSGGRAESVVMAQSGDELRARVVISSCDPHLTFFRLVGKKHLPEDFAQQLARYRMRGSSGKVNLALDRLPSFRCRPGDGPHLRGDIAVGPSIEYLERAYDDAKYGAFSRRPYLNVVIPSLSDGSLAPPGKHVM
ncbi:MAG: NAD(P)/FAD-dependent oxidoreductase, partial [Myxococcales bacterium]|nr:NAD(P)/FAD-dependent oxidoreductase [Myxococcales bacterium]